jgi:hypothetical protein
MNKNINFFAVNLIVIFFTVYAFNLPINFYNILKNDYDKRIVNIYGFCEKESYGYLKQLNEKFKINTNITSFNFEDFPKSSSVFFYKVNYKFDKSKFIILNYNSDDKHHKDYFDKNFFNYKVIDNYKNKCLFLEKRGKLN